MSIDTLTDVYLTIGTSHRAIASRPPPPALALALSPPASVEPRAPLGFHRLDLSQARSSKTGEFPADGVDAPRRHRCAKVEVLNTT